MNNVQIRPMGWSIGGITLLLMILLASAAGAAVNKIDEPVLHPLIPILDEKGEHVLNTGKPYSPKMTCGNGNGSGCHDYDKISHAGGHFEMGRDESDDDFGKKRGGWGHVTSPGYFGGFNCMGPHILAKKKNAGADGFVGDFGAAGMVQDCNHCHTGGGWSEKDRDGIRYDQKDASKIIPLDGDYFNREPVGGVTLAYNNHYKEDTVVNQWDWKKSGVVENDCLMCHGDYSQMKVFSSSQLGDISRLVASEFPSYDLQATPAAPFVAWWQTRNVQLLTRGFFREEATSLLEYLNVKPDSADGMNLVNFQHSNDGTLTPKLDAQGKPILNWHKEAFNADGKVAIPMRKFPANDNCWQCHGWWLEQDRRGFHGFGEQARPARDASNALSGKFDFKNDVHKGAIFTENNGEKRYLENCSGCHTLGIYYRTSFTNVAMDADHNFPKGNADVDVRRDTDYKPGAKSCEYCHNEAANLANPSHLPTLLDAHVKRWTTAGFMAGYPQASLNKIAKTHLDVVGCETCHINALKNFKSKPVTTFYGYRQAENGQQKIVPFEANYQFRYYWKDKSSGRVLYRDELSSVYELKNDEKGNPVASILKDAASGKTFELPLTWASYPASHWNKDASFKKEELYDATRTLKRAYDELLKKKGYTNPDVQMVYVLSNGYLIPHNTRPAKDAVPCGDCHTKKQNGAYSSLVAETGLLGSGVQGTNQMVMSEYVDKRLVDEGVVSFATSYIKITDDNKLVINMKDVLDATKQDGSMSALRVNTATIAGGEWSRLALAEAMQRMKVYASDQQAVGMELGAQDIYEFDLLTGDPRLKAVSLASAVNATSAAVFPAYRLELSVSDLAGSPAPVYSLRMLDEAKKDAADFIGQKVLLKLPYQGSQSDPKQLAVQVASNGAWGNAGMDAQPVLVHPHDDQGDGYAVLAVTKPFKALALTAAGQVLPTIPANSPVPPGSGNPSAGGGTQPTGTPSGTTMKPSDWASIAPLKACTAKSCVKALKQARAKLKSRAQLAMKAQTASDLATEKAANAPEGKKAALAAKAAKRLAKAESAQQAYEQAVTALQGLQD